MDYDCVCLYVEKVTLCSNFRNPSFLKSLSIVSVSFVSFELGTVDNETVILRYLLSPLNV